MSVPDPASTGFSPAEQTAWYAQLPTMFGAAAALFADTRVAAAVRSRDTGTTAYLPWSEP